MTVQQLNRAQREQLKQTYYSERVNSDPSWGELVDIDALVSDEEIAAEYAGVEFTDDDFFA